MSYSDFNLPLVKKKFNLTLSDRENLFAEVTNLEYSNYLKETLTYNLPYALASNTEKSRSEMIIAPILLELTRLFANQISLFSGVDFTIDSQQGLNGNCDFIMSFSPELLIINAPVIIVVEAKKEDIKGGLGQCIAEMIAARLFNEKESNNISTIYGVVTTGEIWKFLRLKQDIVEIDLHEYFLNDLGKILGILAEGVTRN